MVIFEGRKGAEAPLPRGPTGALATLGRGTFTPAEEPEPAPPPRGPAAFAPAAGEVLAARVDSGFGAGLVVGFGTGAPTEPRGPVGDAAMPEGFGAGLVTGRGAGLAVGFGTGAPTEPRGPAGDAAMPEGLGAGLGEGFAAGCPFAFEALIEGEDFGLEPPGREVMEGDGFGEGSPPRGPDEMEREGVGRGAAGFAVWGERETTALREAGFGLPLLRLTEPIEELPRGPAGREGARETIGAREGGDLTFGMLGRDGGALIRAWGTDRGTLDRGALIRGALIRGALDRTWGTEARGAGVEGRKAPPRGPAMEEPDPPLDLAGVRPSASCWSGAMGTRRRAAAKAEIR